MAGETLGNYKIKVEVESKTIDEVINKTEKLENSQAKVKDEWKESTTNLADYNKKLSLIDDGLSDYNKSVDKSTEETSESFKKMGEDINEVIKPISILKDSFKKSKETIKETDPEIQKNSNSFKSLFNQIKSGNNPLVKFGLKFAGIIAGITIGIKIFKKYNEILSKTTDAFIEASVQSAKLEQGLKNVGSVSSLAELQSLFDELQRLTGFDGENIAQAATVLTTFGQSAEDIKTIIPTLLDVQATVGNVSDDLTGIANQFGKLFSDPEEFASTLSRQGILIDVNAVKAITDIEEQRAFVLAEIDRQYGGIAEAMEKSALGSNKLKNATEDMKEAVGEVLAPIREARNELITKFFEWITANAKSIVKAISYISVAVGVLGYTLLIATAPIIAISAAIVAVLGVFTLLAINLNDISGSLDNASTLSSQYADANKVSKKATDDLATSQNTLTKTNAKVKNSTDDMTKSIDDATIAKNTFNEAQLQMDELIPELQLEIDNLGYSYDQLIAKRERLEKRQTRVQNRIDELNAEKAVYEDILGIGTKYANINDVITDELTGEQLNAYLEIFTINDALEKKYNRQDNITEKLTTNAEEQEEILTTVSSVMDNVEGSALGVSSNLLEGVEAMKEMEGVAGDIADELHTAYLEAQGISDETNNWITVMERKSARLDLFTNAENSALGIKTATSILNTELSSAEETINTLKNGTFDWYDTMVEATNLDGEEVEILQEAATARANNLELVKKSLEYIRDNGKLTETQAKLLADIETYWAGINEESDEYANTLDSTITPIDSLTTGLSSLQTQLEAGNIEYDKALIAVEDIKNKATDIVNKYKHQLFLTQAEQTELQGALDILGNFEPIQEDINENESELLDITSSVVDAIADIFDELTDGNEAVSAVIDLFGELATTIMAIQTGDISGAISGISSIITNVIGMAKDLIGTSATFADNILESYNRVIKLNAEIQKGFDLIDKRERAGLNTEEEILKVRNDILETYAQQGIQLQENEDGTFVINEDILDLYDEQIDRISQLTNLSDDLNKVQNKGFLDRQQANLDIMDQLVEMGIMTREEATNLDWKYAANEKGQYEALLEIIEAAKKGLESSSEGLESLFDFNDMIQGILDDQIDANEEINELIKKRIDMLSEQSKLGLIDVENLTDQLQAQSSLAGLGLSATDIASQLSSVGFSNAGRSISVGAINTTINTNNPEVAKTNVAKNVTDNL